VITSFVLCGSRMGVRQSSRITPSLRAVDTSFVRYLILHEGVPSAPDPGNLLLEEARKSETSPGCSDGLFGALSISGANDDVAA